MNSTESSLPHRLRTIQVVNVRWFNATAWYGLKLASLLNAAGHESLVIALADTESFAKAEQLGLHPVALPLNTKNPLEYPDLLYRIRHIIHTFHPHVVNCHRGESFLFWGLLRDHYALVRTRGDQRLPRANLPNRFLHSHVADAVIATNTAMTRYFQKALNVPSERLFTIRGGVDTDVFRFSPEGRERFRSQRGISPDTCVIGLLGRFDRVKGQKELIEAAHILVSEGLPICLVLAGFPTATTLNEVKGWIHDANMESHTIITGKVDDVPGVLSAIDIGVIASLWSEAIARAALELMSCGRPLVSSDVGVMPDLLPPEALVPSGDVVALAALLRRTVTDSDFRHALSRVSEHRIQTLGDEDFLAQTLDAYRFALRRERTSGRLDDSVPKTEKHSLF